MVLNDPGTKGSECQTKVILHTAPILIEDEKADATIYFHRFSDLYGPSYVTEVS